MWLEFFLKQMKTEFITNRCSGKEFLRDYILQKGNTIIPEGRSEKQEEMESKEMISIWVNPNKHWLEKTI